MKRENIDLPKILDKALHLTAEYVWQWMDKHPNCCRPRLEDMNEYDTLLYNVEDKLNLRKYYPYDIAVRAHVRVAIRNWFRDGGNNELWDVWMEQKREAKREEIAKGLRREMDWYRDGWCGGFPDEHDLPL